MWKVNNDAAVFHSLRIFHQKQQVCPWEIKDDKLDDFYGVASHILLLLKS